MMAAVGMMADVAGRAAVTMMMAVGMVVGGVIRMVKTGGPVSRAGSRRGLMAVRIG
jgi:hypothetical protein